MPLTGGNHNDVTQLLPQLDQVPPVAGRVGRPRRCPKAMLADRGYDHDLYRRQLWQRGIRPVIATGGAPRNRDIHEAFPGLAVCVITHRHVQRLRQGL